MFIIDRDYNSPSVTSIGQYAFEGCKLITQIFIPSAVTSIKEGTFHFCSSLEQVTIETPSSLTLIESSAFEECIKLSEFVIPPSVKKLVINLLEYANHSSKL